MECTTLSCWIQEHRAATEGLVEDNPVFLVSPCLHLLLSTNGKITDNFVHGSATAVFNIKSNEELSLLAQRVCIGVFLQDNRHC